MISKEQWHIWRQVSFVARIIGRMKAMKFTDSKIAEFFQVDRRTIQNWVDELATNTFVDNVETMIMLVRHFREQGGTGDLPDTETVRIACEVVDNHGGDVRSWIRAKRISKSRLLLSMEY